MGSSSCLASRVPRWAAGSDSGIPSAGSTHAFYLPTKQAKPPPPPPRREVSELNLLRQPRAAPAAASGERQRQKEGFGGCQTFPMADGKQGVALTPAPRWAAVLVISLPRTKRHLNSPEINAHFFGRRLFSALSKFSNPAWLPSSSAPRFGSLLLSSQNPKLQPQR